jgi:hypothetical protein
MLMEAAASELSGQMVVATTDVYGLGINQYPTVALRRVLPTSVCPLVSYMQLPTLSYSLVR